MKTAMQELIKYANELDFGGWEDVFIQKATELLEKEKEQIADSFKYALKMRFGSESQVNTGEDYYNQTYNQNK